MFETNGLQRMYFQEVETESFQRGIKLTLYLAPAPPIPPLSRRQEHDRGTR